LVNYVVAVGPQDVVINGESNQASCGCGPYYLETEIRCLGSSVFTGNPPAWNAANIWNSPPWYHAILNVPNYNPPNWPDNCVNEPYFPTIIPFTALCPGATYQLRSRENPCGAGGSPGPWTTPFTFTTPGIPATSVLNVTVSSDSICIGQQVSYSASITSNNTCLNSANPSFVWTTIPQQPGTPFTGPNLTFTPVSSCSVFVTASDNTVFCYPSITDTSTLFVGNPVQTVVAAAPSSVCQGGCVPLLATFNVQGVVQWEISPNGITWTAIPGATTASYVHCPVNNLSYFRAQVTGSCNTAVSNVVTVNVTPVAPLTISPGSPSVCVGQTLTLSATGASSYSWNGGNLVNAGGSSQTVSPAVTTTYTVTGNPASACPSVQTITVQVNQVPQLVFSPAAPQVCAGSSFVFTCGSDTNVYSWNIGNTLTSLSPGINDSMLCTPNGSTTYQVTAVSPAGCSVTGFYQVNVLPAPAITSTTDSLRVCAGTPDTLLFSGAVQYSVSPQSGVSLLNAGGSLMEFSPAVSQTYWITGTDSLGCTDSISIYVQADSLIALAAAPGDTLCAGQTLTLSAAGALNYSWTGADIVSGGNTATPLVSPVSTTTYIVTGTDADGCSGSDSAVVLVNPLPAVGFSLAGPDSICESDGPYLLSGATPPGGTFSGTAVTGNLFDPGFAGAGTYSITYTYTDSNGCTALAADTMLVMTCVSVQENSLQNTVVVFPNPVQDMFTIRLGNPAPAFVEVFTADGKLVFTRNLVQTELQVDCSRWASGTYLVQVSQNGQTHTLKLVHR
jgi:hypothetical protein